MSGEDLGKIDGMKPDHYINMGKLGWQYRPLVPVSIVIIAANKYLSLD
jgi:hypothetical protein